MGTKPPITPLTGREKDKLEYVFNEAVVRVMEKRGTLDPFFDAWHAAELLVPAGGEAVVERLADEGMRLRDEAIKILIELVTTAAVMEALDA